MTVNTYIALMKHSVPVPRYYVSVKVYNPSKNDKSCAESPCFPVFGRTGALSLNEGSDTFPNNGGNRVSGDFEVVTPAGVSSEKLELDCGTVGESEKVPNESSSSMRSNFCVDEPDRGNESACGKGEGGAGQRPGLAAARSISVIVRACCDFFSSLIVGFEVLAVEGGGRIDSEGFTALLRGRGGDRVRRADEDGELAKSLSPNCLL